MSETQHQPTEDSKLSRRGLERHLAGLAKNEWNDDLATAVEELTEEEQAGLAALMGTATAGEYAAGVDEEMAAALENQLAEYPEISEAERTQSLNRMMVDLLRRYRHQKLVQSGIRTAQKLITNPRLAEAKKQELMVGIRTAEERLQEGKRMILQSPEAFIGSALLEIRELQRQMLQTGLAEVESIREIEQTINEELDHGIPVFLTGETGTGKTVLAKMIARRRAMETLAQERAKAGAASDDEASGTTAAERAKQKAQRVASRRIESEADSKLAEPILVSGHSFMTKEELVGYLGLAATEHEDPLQVEAAIRERVAAWTQLHPEATEEEQVQAKELLEAIGVTQADSKTTVTKFFWGPVQEAAARGKVLIIDEFNYVPPSLFAILNDAISQSQQLARGETVTINVPGEEPIVVKKGFGLILTGNMNTAAIKERYTGRNKVDTAAINRIHTLEYPTPSQATSEAFAASIIEPAEFKAGAESADRELYQIALAVLTDERGNLRAPAGTLQQLWQFCSAMKLFQRNFAGEPLSDEEKAQGEGMSSNREFRLKTIHPSMRQTRDILERWKSDGFTQPLDSYLYDGLIEQARLNAPEDAVYLYQMLQGRYDFFPKTAGWEAAPSIDKVRSSGIEKPTQTTAPTDMKFFQPAEIARAFWGVEVPPTAEATPSTESQNLEASREAEQLLERIAEELKLMETAVHNLCADEAALAQP